MPPLPGLGDLTGAFLAALMLAIAVYSGVSVLAEIGRIQQAAGTLPSQLAAGNPLRIRFDQLHQLSTRLMSINIVAALALLYWEAREQAR